MCYFFSLISFQCSETFSWMTNSVKRSAGNGLSCMHRVTVWEANVADDKVRRKATAIIHVFWGEGGIMSGGAINLTPFQIWSHPQIIWVGSLGVASPVSLSAPRTMSAQEFDETYWGLTTCGATQSTMTTVSQLQEMEKATYCMLFNSDDGTHHLSTEWKAWMREQLLKLHKVKNKQVKHKLYNIRTFLLMS